MGCTTSGDPRWRVGLVRPRWGQWIPAGRL